LEEKEFRDLLDRCLEGTASAQEEELLIEAAEASPDRVRYLLEIASFDAALRPPPIKAGDFAQNIIASVGHNGKTGAFARAMRTRLESERRGRRPPPPELASGVPPVVFGLVAAAALVALGFLLWTPREASKPLSRSRPPAAEPKFTAPAPNPRREPPEPFRAPPVAPRSDRPQAAPAELRTPPPAEALPGKREAPRPLTEPDVRPPGPPAKPEPLDPGRPATLAAAAILEGPVLGTAFLLSGEQERILESGASFLPGEGLRTADLSRIVTVRFPDGTRLEVGPNTELRDIFDSGRAEPEREGKRLRVIRGKVKAIVARQPRGQPMVFESPQASIKVLGTTLRISVDELSKVGTRLEVIEGKVELRNLGGKSVTVESGHFAMAAVGVELISKPIPLEKKPGLPSAILDPSFENQSSASGGALVAPWTGEGPATIGVDETNGMNGTKCAYIYEGNGTGAWSDVVQTIPVAANTIYTLTCYIQTDAGFRARGSVGVRTVGGAVIAQVPYGQMTDYTQFTIKFNSGISTSVVIFAGFASNLGRKGTWIHVDDWTLVP
jgi:hypothetical protein